MKVPSKVMVGIGTVSLIGMAVLLPYITPHRASFELAYFIAQTLLAGIAVAALLYARDQVNEARVARDHMRDQLEESQSARLAALSVAKANFLLEMDRRWDSPELSQGFAQLGDLRRAASGDVAKFTEALAALRRDNLPDYRTLLNVLGFFETLGLLLKRGYVDEADLDSLFGGAVVDAGKFLKPHIEARQQEAKKGGVPRGMYENAVYLMDRMNALDATRLAGTLGDDTQSGGTR